MFFVDSMNGWVVGEKGTGLKSSDGGLSWKIQSKITNDVMNDIFFLNTTYGWSAGENGVVLNTTDSGENWDL